MKFQFYKDDIINEFINSIAEITFFYKSKEELSALQKCATIEKNSKTSFLNNVLIIMPVVWAVYAIIAAVITKNLINYKLFMMTIVILIIITIILFFWSLYTQYLVKKLDKKLLAIDYVLENYNDFYKK